MNKIKELRKATGWDVVECGKRLGLSHRTIEGYSQGRPIPECVVILIDMFIQEYGK